MENEQYIIWNKLQYYEVQYAKKFKDDEKAIRSFCVELVFKFEQ